jgi:hypothetical protein
MVEISVYRLRNIEMMAKKVDWQKAEGCNKT